MQTWWWIIPAAAGILALGMLAGGMSVLFRRPYRAIGGILSGGVLLAAAAAVLLLGADIQTYRRLAYERPVGTIELHQTGDRSFSAALTEPPRGGQPALPRVYALQGDEWRVEARVLKWKPWANLLGLDARYRLDRLSGEFIDVEAERSGPRSVYDLRSAANGDVLKQLAARLDQARLIDTVYGSAVLMPMADGARYELSMSQSGLVARSANDQATQAVENWH